MFASILRFACVLTCLLVASCGKGGSTTSAPATLVLRNGVVITEDPAKTAPAQAIAMRDGVITAVGSNEEIQPLVGPGTQAIDLQGQTAIPGFIEGHGHLMNLGDMKRNLDLMDCKNWDEVVAKVAEAAKNAKPGDWITGRGWHQEKWDRKPEPNVEGFPLHDSLSRLTPDNPVLLTHASNHATFVNAKAMEIAGITAKTPDPPGGEILKDAAGNPIGVLRENASALVTLHYQIWLAKRTAADPAADAREKIRLAVQEALSNGVTSFQDAGEDFATIDRIRQAVLEGQVGVRLWVMVRDSNKNLREKLPQYKAVGLADNHLTIASIKVIMDGALGSHGAWMLDDYSDLPGHRGLNTYPVSDLKETAQIALDNDVQLCVHAIGDRTNREVLDVYEEAFKSRPNARDLRWRIEHAQILSPTDIPRFAQLGVIASMQGLHATSDAPFVLARLGPVRAQGAYAWQTLMKSGAIVSNGTDTPAERINPIANYYATVTRKLKDGTTFYPEQRLTREEGLRSMTILPAYAAKEETIKGSLVAGKLADITVLSKNILTVPDDEIPATRVVYTIVGGKIMYQGAAGSGIQ